MAAVSSGTAKPLCMPCDEGCRTAVLGKTERTVGWEGDGEPTMIWAIEALHWGKPAATDRPYLPSLSHPFTLDFVALCRTRQEAEAVLAKIQGWVEQHGLCLHPDKTRVSNCMEKGQGFEFLGYRFEAGRRWVRPKSRKALRDKLREKTGRTRSGSLETIIAELNPILKGWFGYFQHAHRTTFRDVDGFVRRRLRAILHKREKLPTGELCAGEPHAQFGGRGGRESFPTPINKDLWARKKQDIKTFSRTSATAEFS